MARPSIRIPSPGALAARSWGNERRAPGAPSRPRAFLLLFAVMLATVACGGPSASSQRPSGSVAAPTATQAAPSATPASLVPSPSESASPSPSVAVASPSAGTSPAASGGTVDSLEEAIAAVGAVDPQYLGYEPSDPDLIGQANQVIAHDADEGFLLTFVTGSGDCFAGCITNAYAKYEVTPAGEVTRLCQWIVEAGTVIEGKEC